MNKAYLITEFSDPRMGIIYYVLEEMWRRMEIAQLCKACAALLERDRREIAEKETMLLKVGIIA